MKKILINTLLLLLYTVKSFAQSDTISAKIKTDYEGTWQYRDRYMQSTIIIRFEADKDYVTVYDVGTGEAPTIKLEAQVQGNKLTVPSRLHHNDYVELEIVKKRLELRTKPTIRDEHENEIPSNLKLVDTRRFKKVKNATFDERLILSNDIGTTEIE